MIWFPALSFPLCIYIYEDQPQQRKLPKPISQLCRSLRKEIKVSSDKAWEFDFEKYGFDALILGLIGFLRVVLV